MEPTRNPALTEFEIRTALLSYLSARTDCSSAKVREEVPIGRSRVDVVRLSTTIEGFEIKSDFDSCQRLKSQAESFDSVCDQNTLVTGSALFVESERLVPSWWGILLARSVASRDGEGRVQLHTVRPALANPRQSAAALAAMLWKNELVDALNRFEVGPVPRSWSSLQMREKLAAGVAADQIRALVVERLRDPERAAPLALALAQRRVRAAARPSKLMSLLLRDSHVEAQRLR